MRTPSSSLPNSRLPILSLPLPSPETISLKHLHRSALSPTWSTKPTHSLFPDFDLSSSLILKRVPRLGDAASCGCSKPRVWRAANPERAAAECGSGENERVSRTCPWSSVLCGNPFDSYFEKEGGDLDGWKRVEEVCMPGPERLSDMVWIW